MARRFHLYRRSDVSGVSGLGKVAEGIEWSDGTVAVRWLTVGTAKANDPDIGRRVKVKPTTVIHDDIASVIGIHGHNGATEVVWDD